MRKIVLFVVTLLLWSITAEAKIYVVKINGGPNGYNEIREEVDRCDGFLFCQNPGYEPCRFTIPPCNSSYTNIFIETVENQIRNGVLIGSFIDNGYLVSWVSTRNGEDEYVEITIEEIE